MKYYRLNEVPIQSDDQVFKASPFVAGVTLVVFLAIICGAILFGFYGVAGNSPARYIFFVAGACIAVFGLFAFHSFRASLKSSNWLLRCNHTGVIIHYRSFLNWRFPAEDVQAVGFDYSEIAWARTVKERRKSPSPGGAETKTQQYIFLNLCLVAADTAALEKYLEQEGRLESKGIMIARDYPVQVLPGGIVELRWSGISPSASKAINFLSQHIRIASADSRKADLTYQKNSSPEETDGKILKLIKSGDEMGAMTLTRQTYGCSLAEAKDYLTKLRSGAR